MLVLRVLEKARPMLRKGKCPSNPNDGREGNKESGGQWIVVEWRHRKDKETH